MKKQKTLKSKYAISPRKEKRFFSEAARKSIVAEIEAEHISKAEASRKYQVSQASIYKWIRKYSASYHPALVTIIEHKSDSNKNKALQAELSDTYEQLGRLQVENMLLQKIIELAGAHFATDLKKNFAKQHLPVSTKKKKSIQ